MDSPNSPSTVVGLRGFSRDDEHRLKALRARADQATPGAEPLTPAEQHEFLELQKLYEQFEQQGELNLRRGKAAAADADSEPATLGTAIGSVFGTAARAGLFWGSLVSTAAPGYLGRKMGLTDEYRHWNWITPTLILGALPVISKLGTSGNHLAQIGEQCRGRDTRVGLVVSCLTKAEMEGFGVAYPRFANHADWEAQLGVHHAELLEITDMCADGADEHEVCRVVRRMKAIATEFGAATYVHCKAGKGRSWMIVMCYLMTQEGLSFDDARTLVKTKRHQVSPSASQTRFAQSFAEWYNGNAAARALHDPTVVSPAARAGAAGGPPALADADATLTNPAMALHGPSRNDLDRLAGSKAADEWAPVDE